MLRKSKFIVLLIIVFSGYSFAQCEKAIEVSNLCNADNNSIWFDRDSNTVCFNGEIDESSAFLVKTLPIDRELPLKLVANSNGGDVSSAIDIAEHLDKYDIYVTQHCLSACSQFLFMQAKHKYVIHEGMIAIHGGPWTKEEILAADFPDENKTLLIGVTQRFEKFYTDRNINIDILTTPPPQLHAHLAAGEIIFWMPKKAEFEQYGVHNIHYCDSKFGK
ncbi:hypothetical protein [Alishewanella longhuensis]